MLDVIKISRSFGGTPAVSGVSFTVQPGRMTGFVGRNGAGKTTTMRIILGVLSADDGEVHLYGSRMTSVDRRRFGYMPEERGLYPKMKVGEQLIYLARLHGLGPRAAAANTAGLLDRLGLADRSEDPVETLSLGNQQRAQIGAALVHDPEVLILDEPFSGLDPVAVEVVLSVLRERAEAGVPVLFSSHQLDVVERLCDDLVIIADGRIRAAGSGDELRRAHRRNSYELSAATDTGWLRDVPGIEVTDFAGSQAIFDAESPDAAQVVLRQALDRGPVHSFTPRQPRLAEIFQEVIQ